MFSCCTVLYGDYPRLAHRCLDSLVLAAKAPGRVTDVRIGLNEVSAETEAVVQDMIPHWTAEGISVFVYRPERNVGKYPLMRRMLYDKYEAPQAYILWLDDDNFLMNPSSAWWQKLVPLALQSVQVGQLWSILQRGRQWQAIRAQPWFRRAVVGPRHRFRFATGGWWVAQWDFLSKWNYPFPELHHNGGDSILGELIRQQGKKLLAFDADVHVNDPKKPGGIPRRGIGVDRSTEKYIWQDWEEGKPIDLSHQEFECQIQRFL